MHYFFRKPKFPIICDIDGVLILASSANSLEKRLKNLILEKENLYAVIDSTIEGWSLDALDDSTFVISPLALKKRWTKMDLINLYNQSENCKKNNKPYSEKSLSSKKLSVVFNGISELIKTP